MICWQPGWRDFDLRDKEYYFLRELKWEIEGNPGHPLFGKDLRIVGWRAGYDDFILQIVGESGYVYVHLTWARETAPTFPWCKFLACDDELNTFLVDGFDFD